eukprot:6695417-Pyramimonas_sp.AAC.2
MADRLPRACALHVLLACVACVRCLRALLACGSAEHDPGPGSATSAAAPHSPRRGARCGPHSLSNTAIRVAYADWSGIYKSVARAGWLALGRGD